MKKLRPDVTNRLFATNDNGSEIKKNYYEHPVISFNNNCRFEWQCCCRFWVFTWFSWRDM